MRYRKKLVVVEAHRWMTNDNEEPGAFGNDHMAEWLGKAYRYIQGGLAFTAIDGRELVAQPGDWIVRQETDYGSDFWPVAPGTFAATYEPVEETPR
jgi:hypothetical protein